MKRDALVRSILRKTGQRCRNGVSSRPYMTRKEMLQVSSFLDMIKEELSRKGKQTGGK